MTTSSPRIAPGSMMAVGWICCAMASGHLGVVDEGEHQVGRRHDLPAHAALALRAGDAAADLGDLDHDVQLVAGPDGLAPLDLVAAHEQRGLALRGRAADEQN